MATPPSGLAESAGVDPHDGGGADGDGRDDGTAPGLTVDRRQDGTVVLRLSGRLSVRRLGPLWRQAHGVLHTERPARLVIDAAGVTFVDVAGATLLVTLLREQQEEGRTSSLEGLRRDVAPLVELVDPGPPEPSNRPTRRGFFERLGRGAFDLADDVARLVAFTGHLTESLVSLVRYPGRFRLRDAVDVAELAGVTAIPLVVVFGFLFGLILAFQSIIPLRTFGAQVFVADLLGAAMFRELGPLMTAILVSARSGSAFAAELGTMKVNEEIDALRTMGIEPVDFLVLPRVVAAVAVIPGLTLLLTGAALAGGSLVFLSLGYSFTTFVVRVIAATSLIDFLTGLGKAMVLGVVVGGIGCLRGLETGRGAGEVGRSTTSAVVSGILLIVVVEGLFALAFAALGL
jgi:phospholipid/cholesterol/gamma-HCH transport system permease protein